MNTVILDTQNVKRTFVAHGKPLHALSDITLSCQSGQSLGLVGESGCGKTTLNRLLLALDKPTAGRVRYKGRDLASLSRADKLSYRMAVQPVFQNPYSSLDPRMQVHRIIGEPLLVSGMQKKAINTRVNEVLHQVGLSPDVGSRYPVEFSGGQRQRIAIARALASRPELLLLDEPVSSQDISIRAQILNTLKDLQEEYGLATLFVSHDLATVRFMCDEVLVMYLGRIVETGPAARICSTPDHPYTRALLAATLPLDPDAVANTPPIGELPSPLNPPSGCAYHTRCPNAQDICHAERPILRKTPTGTVACHLSPTTES